MNFRLYRLLLGALLVAAVAAWPAAASAQTVTTVTIRNELRVPLKYRSGSRGTAKESPAPAAIIAPGSAATYRLSRYADEASAGSATYEADSGGPGCRFRYATARTPQGHWRFDNDAAPSGPKTGRGSCGMIMVKADARTGTQSLVFTVR